MARNSKFGKAKFVVTYWDMFDNETDLVGGASTFDKAEAIVQKKFGGRIQVDGADWVEIVDQDGNVVARYSVG